MDEFIPVIPKGLTELLRRSFPDRAPANVRDAVDNPEYDPMYRAGIETVIAHIEHHYQTQEES